MSARKRDTRTCKTCGSGSKHSHGALDEIITILWFCRSSCPKALNLVAIHSLHHACYRIHSHQKPSGYSVPMSFWLLAGTDQAACRTRVSWSHRLSVDIVRCAKLVQVCSDALACWVVLWFLQVFLTFWSFGSPAFSVLCHCSPFSTTVGSTVSVCVALHSTVAGWQRFVLLESLYVWIGRYVKNCTVTGSVLQATFSNGCAMFWRILNRRNSITGFCLMFRFCSLTNSFYSCKLHTNTFVVSLHPISRLLFSSPTARNCPKKCFG